MRVQVLLSMLALGMAIGTAEAGEGQEQQVNLRKCPQEVQKTLRKEAGNGKIVELETEQEDGVTVYEAEVEFRKLRYEIEVRADGTLLSKVLEGIDDDDDEEEKEGSDDDEDEDEKEERVRRAELPKRVQRTLARESRGGKIEEIEKEQIGDKIVFEAEVEFGEREYEIVIAADGTLLKKVLEEEDDDDDDDEDEDDE